MPEPDASPATASKAQRLSKDGQWRSFPRVPNLLQYVNSGIHHARVKTRGKLIRRSLETNVFTTAKLRLLDFLQRQRAYSKQVEALTFGEAAALYLRSVENDPRVKPQSREYRRSCIRKIEMSWPELNRLKIDRMNP